MSKPVFPDLRGAQMVGQRRVFVPMHAIEMRKQRAADLMSPDDPTAMRWAAAFQDMGRQFGSGADVAEISVPVGGASVVTLLGFFVTFVRHEPAVGLGLESDVIRVQLADPMANMKVLS